MNSLTVIYVALIACSIFFLIVNAVLQIRVKRIAESTHIIVNSQRTVMLRAIALLSRRVASENPNDGKAQTAAKAAEEDAERADHHGRVMI